MKLQIGSGRVRGKYRGRDWTNIDIINCQDVNVLGSALELPFATCSIEEIHCVHVLEHVTRDKYPIMLKEMHRVLRVGGRLYIETPDFHATLKWAMSAFDQGDTQAIHNWTTSIYGKNETAGMAHYWGFYEGLLRRAFRHQGFDDIERLVTKEDMISTHYQQEPILLVRGTK